MIVLVYRVQINTEIRKTCLAPLSDRRSSEQLNHCPVLFSEA